MCDGLTSTLLAAAVSGVAGVLAWIVTNFFAEPLLEFRKLRKAVHESLFFNANVGSISKGESIDVASVDLRRYAAALNAFWVTAPNVVKAYLARCGYNVEGASSNLVGFSNSIHLEEGTRAIHRYRIEKGLRLPLSYTDEEIQDVIAENRRRNSRS